MLSSENGNVYEPSQIAPMLPLSSLATSNVLVQILRNISMDTGVKESGSGPRLMRSSMRVWTSNERSSRLRTLISVSKSCLVCEQDTILIILMRVLRSLICAIRASFVSRFSVYFCLFDYTRNQARPENSSTVVENPEASLSRLTRCINLMLLWMCSWKVILTVRDSFHRFNAFHITPISLLIHH